jgi:ribosomal-protein-serine acetyltransferase
MLRSLNYLFRPLAPDDAPAFVEAVLESTSNLQTWMPWAHDHYTINEAQHWIALCQQWWEERSNFEFGIFDGVSGAFVGGCGLNKFDRMHGCCNLGYWVRQSCQRRGAATEAIGCLSTFGFSDLSLGRIEIVAGIGNMASLGAARKAGVVEEGIARNRLRLRDRFIDAHVLSLVLPAA